MILGDGFDGPDLPTEAVGRLDGLARAVRADVLRLTTLSGQGAPGAALSSVEVELTVRSFGRFDPANPFRRQRDRVVDGDPKAGEGTCAVLAHLGYFDRELLLSTYARAGSPFGDRPGREVPGVDWALGTPGEELTVATGFALAARLWRDGSRVFCLLGPADPSAGTLREARRFAVARRLGGLVALLLTGRFADDPARGEAVASAFATDGWTVIETDGHDPVELHRALRQAVRSEGPVCLVARTDPWRGVLSGAGAPPRDLPLEDGPCAEALRGLGSEPDLAHWRLERGKPLPDWRHVLPRRPVESAVLVDAGHPRTFEGDAAPSMAQVFSETLADVGQHAATTRGGPPLVALGSGPEVPSILARLLETRPELYLGCGVEVRHAALMNGALSLAGVVSFRGASAIYGISESYGPARLNDVNGASAKLAVQHAGLGGCLEAGTSPAIDTFGLLNSSFGWHVFTPADPNQCDRIVRYMATHRGNQAIVLGRPNAAVVPREDGTPFFGGDYVFEPRRADRIRHGHEITLVAAGDMLGPALEAWNELAAEGSEVDLFSVAAWCDVGENSLVEMARHGRLVCVEDHNPRSGLGTWLQARFNDLGLLVRVRKLAVTSHTAPGPVEDLYRLMGIDAAAIARAVRQEIVRRGTLGPRFGPGMETVF